MNIDTIVKKIGYLYSTSTETPTNFDLAKSIVNEIPVDWKDPSLKILDPFCGRGTFLLAVADKLEKAGHSRKHIVEKMLYGMDTNSVQVMITIKALSMFYNGKINIQVENSLLKDTTMKFDIVLGNPPYQNGKDTNFYSKFMKKAEELSKEIVIMITPNFASLSNKNSLPKNLVLYKDMAHRAFENIQLPSGTCYYMQNFSDTSDTMKFIDHSGNEAILKTADFVLVKDSKVIPLLKKIKSKKTLGPMYYHGNNSFKVKDNGRYTYIDKVGNNETEASVLMSDTAPSEELLKNWKVVVSYNAPGAKFEDKKMGTTKIYGPGVGITGSVVCLTVDSETKAINLKKYLDSKLVKYIIKSCKYATNNSKAQFDLLPLIPLDKELDLYNHFSLTKAEIDYIESNAN